MAGRPTIMTEERVNKLEEAFALGCSDLEACFYADISKQTLYNYQDKNPSFVDRKEALKKNPVLKARKTVLSAIESGDEKVSQWVLDKHDGKAKQAIDHQSSDGSMTPNSINVSFIDVEDDEQP